MSNSQRVVVIDYGLNNLHSVVKALERVGHTPQVATKPDTIATAPALVLPGVGSSDAAMEALSGLGMVSPILDALERDVPFLGVCMGLALLLERSEEGTNACLGAVKGRAVRFPHDPTGGLKVPHMGWNQVRFQTEHPVLKGIPQGSDFYFVHSYYAVLEDPSLIAGTSYYGQEFCSVVARKNLVATQFHPEKSGVLGLALYYNFVRFALGPGVVSQWR